MVTQYWFACIELALSLLNRTKLIPPLPLSSDFRRFFSRFRLNNSHTIWNRGCDILDQLYLPLVHPLRPYRWFILSSPGNLPGSLLCVFFAPSAETSPVYISHSNSGNHLPSLIPSFQIYKAFITFSVFRCPRLRS